MIASTTVLTTSGSGSAAPILTFVGALLVALITAYTANKRQHTALAAEKQRLDQQLAAEAARHAATLNHERQIHDLEELRRVLDSATETLNLALIKTSRVLPYWEDLAAGAPAVRVERVKELNREASSAIIAADASWYRLTLRLGPDHEVPKTLRDLTKSLSAMTIHMRETLPKSGNLDRDAVSDAAALDETRKQAMTDFQDAAARWVGSQLPSLSGASGQATAGAK